MVVETGRLDRFWVCTVWPGFALGVFDEQAGLPPTPAWSRLVWMVWLVAVRGSDLGSCDAV